MDLQTIISQSGTTHYVNPKPAFLSSNAKLLGTGRVQTLCEMHIQPEDSASANGKKCPFCQKEAERLAEMEQ